MISDALVPADGDSRVGLVGCVKSKRPTPASAKDLYTSALFAGRKRWVESHCSQWFVLSALHGLVDPETVLAPYDKTLTAASPSAREQWSRSVLSQLQQALGNLRGLTFEIHAGSAYRDHGLVSGLLALGATVEIPAAGKSLGQQLAFYSSRDAPETPTPRPSPSVTEESGGAQHPARDTGGKYAPLAAHLMASSSPASLSFRQLEDILGAPLPMSARRHRPWWGNHRAHSQAQAWMDAGWQVAAVDLGSRSVTFTRTRS